jgi:hypothetical protein
MAEPHPTLAQLNALIGTWTTQATHPLFDGVVTGSATFEWLEGGHFLVQRSRNDHELFPDSISIIGSPDGSDALVMEYFDSRGVRRTYSVSFDAGILHICRDDPTFAQRFSARLAHDHFDALWQVARTPGVWQDDLEVSYRRAT